MMKSRNKQLRLIAACSVAIFSLAGLIGGSFAWFVLSLNATTESTSFSVKAGDNIQFDLYYLHHFAVDQSTNKNGNYNYDTDLFAGYENEYSNPVFTQVNYDSEGHVTDLVDPTNIGHLWPAHKITYAIAITSGELSSFSLFSWAEITSASILTQVNSQDVRVSLSWAIDMYGGAYYVNRTNDVNSDIANGFATYLADDTVTDKFTYSQTNIAPETKPTIEILNSISGESGNDKRVVLYFSIAFSNDSSTFYRYSDPYYVKDTSGNSNCYEKLSLTNLVFKLVQGKETMKKLKGILSNKRTNIKVITLTLVAFANLTAVTLGTFAWFNLSARDSLIDIVSGDLDIEINKVTAYKYVYPYYTNSTEFIDYDSEGTIKKFVLEDHTLEYDSTSVEDIEITSDDATISLGTKWGNVDTKTTSPESASSRNICIPTGAYVPEFRYYLVGDNTFCGVDNSWHLTDGFAFALGEDVTNEKPAVLDNVVVSAGSTFRLLETFEFGSSNVYEYFYYPLTGITETNSPFRIIDDDNTEDGGDRLLCLRSGIYKFTFTPGQLKIELHTKEDGARIDISVISNNSMDPTKVVIDYAGSNTINKTDPEAPNYFPDPNSYLATAIYNQNTSMVLDVELNFKNANDIDVSLQVERTAASSNSIYNVAGKYEDTTHNLTGYVDDAHMNPLRASDFFNYYSVFTKTPYASTSAIWTAMHRQGDVNSKKFINGETYDTTVDCPLNLKEVDDSALVPASDPTINHIYHCYITIEYDYEHGTYFLDKNRLGKKYILDRDFGFHFYGTQHMEETE